MKGKAAWRALGMRVARFVPAGLWYAVIWLFSAQTGGESQEVSDGVLELLGYDIPNSPMALSALLSFLVRKGAHMGVFFVLTALLYWGLQEVKRPVRGALAVGLCAALAALDEFHQTFVPGRSGRWQDVAIDVLGAFCFLAGLAVVRAIRKKWGAKKGRP